MSGVWCRRRGYLGVWLLEGDSGVVDERRVAEQLSGGSGVPVTAAAAMLVEQDGREADVDRVFQGLELRLLTQTMGRDGHGHREMEVRHRTFHALSLPVSPSTSVDVYFSGLL